MNLSRVASSLLLILLAAALYACADEDSLDTPDLTSSAKIDLPRYMGTWHVIANIPYFAERGKVAGRDVYRLDADGNVETTYVYRKSFDSPEKTTGSLGIVQPGSDAAR